MIRAVKTAAGKPNQKIRKTQEEETIMWKDLDFEQMEREENSWAGPRPPEEV